MKTQKLILPILLLISFLSFSQETYKINNTEYYYGKYYSTTGKAMVKRSETNKRNFLRSIGYSKIPYGYEIDHIKPLSKGGKDSPINMQLLSIKQHKIKTARERVNTSLSTNKSLYNLDNKINSTYYQTGSNGRTIQTGPRGGKYYINSNGNKTYIKKKN